MNEVGSDQFLNMAIKYRRGLNVIFQEGKAGIKARAEDGLGFEKLTRHSVVVAVLCETMANFFGMDEETKNKLVKSALMHDADKKVEKHPEIFSQEEKSNLYKKIQDFGADKDIIAATKIEFMDTYEKSIDKAPLPKMIMYYCDMLVAFDKIVTFDERMEDSRKRNKEVPEEIFQRETKFGHNMEIALFNRLPSQLQSEIGKPEDLPKYLKQILS